MNQALNQIDWKLVDYSLNLKGYALIPKLITAKECDVLSALYGQEEMFRKTVVMERYRFGLGEYKYFDYPLPDLIERIRTQVYQNLVPLANQWMNVLNIDTRFPPTLFDLHRECKKKKQNKATPLILKYGPGGFNTLHQDIYGDIYFPLQAVLFLKEPNIDYSGGEFVLVQQKPRAQSRPIVLTPKKGDMLIFTTNFRPIKGKRGYYRANMKHGVSEVINGERKTLGIIFHDATS